MSSEAVITRGKDGGKTPPPHKGKRATRFQIYGVKGDHDFDRSLAILHAIKEYEFPTPRKFEVDENGSDKDDFQNWLDTTVEMRQKMGAKAAAHSSSPLIICNGNYLGGLNNLCKYIKKKFHMSADDLLRRVGMSHGGLDEEAIEEAKDSHKPPIPKPHEFEKKQIEANTTDTTTTNGARDSEADTRAQLAMRARIKAARTATRQALEHADRFTYDARDEERREELMSDNKRVREELIEANERLTVMLNQKNKNSKKPSPLFLIKAGQTLQRVDEDDDDGMSVKEKEDRDIHLSLEKKVEALQDERKRVMRRLDRGGHLRILELTNILIDKDRAIVQILGDITTLDNENELQKGEEVTALRNSLRGLRSQQEAYAKAQNLAQTIIRAYQAKAKRNKGTF